MRNIDNMNIPRHVVAGLPRHCLDHVASAAHLASNVSSGFLEMWAD
jgi:hypothetical protein